MLFALPLAAQAQASAPASTPPNEAVARTFIAAAQAQDRKAALNLLDEKVSIQFPGSSGHGEGQPFVIGYLDGLFLRPARGEPGGRRGWTGAARCVSWLMTPAVTITTPSTSRSRISTWCAWTVRIEPETSAHQAVAALDPS